MLEHLIRKWKANHGDVNPRHILYFQDGVSDSQYAAVRTHEVDRIATLLLNTFGVPPAQVTVTAVVCTKRHHTRFYRETSNDNTRPGKLCPSIN